MKTLRALIATLKESETQHSTTHASDAIYNTQVLLLYAPVICYNFMTKQILYQSQWSGQAILSTYLLLIEYEVYYHPQSMALS